MAAGQRWNQRQRVNVPGEGRSHGWVTRDKQATPAWGRAPKPIDLYPTALLCLLPSRRCSWREHSISERHCFRGGSAESGPPDPSAESNPCAWDSRASPAPTPCPTHAAPIHQCWVLGATHGPGTWMLSCRSQDRHLKGTSSCLREKGLGELLTGLQCTQPAAHRQQHCCREPQCLQGELWHVEPGFLPTQGDKEVSLPWQL